MPPRWCSQAEILEGLAYARHPVARKMFLDNGMDGRFMSLAPEHFHRTAEPGYQQQVFQRAAVDLAEAAVRRLMDERGLVAEDVAALVSITSYGFVVPSISAHLVERLGLRRNITKLDLTGAGCLGSISLLHAAQSLVERSPDDLVIAVASEIGSVFMRDWPVEDRGNMVINALMGDAAVAMLVGGEDDREQSRPQPRLIDTEYASAPETLDLVDIRVGPDGTMAGHILREVPAVARELYLQAAAALFERNGIRVQDVDHWALHPGSRLVIESVQDALGLSDEQLAISRRVLRTHGNVCSATAMLCLHEHMHERDIAPGDIGVLGGIGPGMTVGLTLLRWI